MQMKVKEETGWNIIWGPVYISDIKNFLGNQLKKTPEIRGLNSILLKESRQL